MPKVCEPSDSLWERGISAREACLNEGRGLCLVVAADRVRGGVGGRGRGRPSLLAWTALDACGCMIGVVGALTCVPMALRPLWGGVAGWRSRQEPPSRASPVPLGSAPIGTLIPPKCVLPLGFAPTSFPAPHTAFTSPCRSIPCSDASSWKPSLTLFSQLRNPSSPVLSLPVIGLSLLCPLSFPFPTLPWEDSGSVRVISVPTAPSSRAWPQGTTSALWRQREETGGWCNGC